MGVFKEFEIVMMEQELEAEFSELDKQLVLLDNEVLSVVEEAKRMIEKIQWSEPGIRSSAAGW